MKKFYILLVSLAMATVTTQVSAKMLKHSVKRGETLYSIAHKNHITIKKLRKVNGLKQGDILRLGKVLSIPKNRYIAKKKKSKKSNRILSSALTRHSKPLASKRVRRDTIDEIFFKSSQPNIVFSKMGMNKKGKNIIQLAKMKLGRKYVWGAVGKRNTFDCSGLTKYVYKKNGINIPRTSINQSRYGQKITRNKLKKGDLIFFDTSKRRKGYVNHVGIYLGNNKFIHASSAKKKVVITSLNQKFYSQRYRGARRPL